MTSIGNIRGRLRGEEVFSGQVGDPCIYKGQVEMYVPWMDEDELKNIPLEKDEEPLTDTGEVLHYIVDTYGQFLKDIDAGIRHETHEWGSDKFIFYDVGSEKIFAKQNLHSEFLPYAKNILEETIDQFAMKHRDRPYSYLIRDGEGGWIFSDTDDLARLGLATPIDVIDIVQGYVPGAMHYIRGNRHMDVNRDCSNADYSLLGDRLHAEF